VSKLALGLRRWRSPRRLYPYSAAGQGGPATASAIALLLRNALGVRHEHGCTRTEPALGPFSEGQAPHSALRKRHL